ncbi:MAG: helix-turn-helix domain-containing protein [Pyrinomonadaceae bacterium]
MPRKKNIKSDFGLRLVAVRKSRGLTQYDLANLIGTTQRTVSYYENEAGYPQATVMAELARALNISTDELLGVKASRIKKALPKDDPQTQRAWKRFQQLKRLPEKDQRAVIRLVNSLVAARGNGKEVVEKARWR